LSDTSIYDIILSSTQRRSAWGVYLQEEYFQRIKEAGLNGVRIPIRWSAHANTKPPYTIKQKFLDRIDWAVNQALSRGLVVVINTHHYEEMATDPQGHRERFLALWAQIADHYKDYPNDLLFEPMNEPNGSLTAALWNSLVAEAIDTIRDRWGHGAVVRGRSIELLGKLRLSDYGFVLRTPSLTK